MSSLDLLAQSELSSPDFTPSLMGKKSKVEKGERFSQDMPPGYLYRLKLAPQKRNKMFTVKELRKNGSQLENTHMESTYHPCMYIPHEDFEFRPYMQHLVLGTQAQQQPQQQQIIHAQQLLLYQHQTGQTLQNIQQLQQIQQNEANFNATGSFKNGNRRSMSQTYIPRKGADVKNSRSSNLRGNLAKTSNYNRNRPQTAITKNKRNVDLIKSPRINFSASPTLVDFDEAA
ncbi:hypothetical protein TRFO_22428 [Tritrichomonas foetus]|uniref:Uncharacterized protein n=1 Tax=Tritrichomonas foetus TaxID=1144522 RepID=A0A1J4KHV9_9EUKA|nr:hypothetical protein TRFO_22428 [Tritrichomonas foetus]|eukprot:OHT08917.1 hypothetical protein TRFO_22428 [Tritrichomonas foetus]